MRDVQVRVSPMAAGWQIVSALVHPILFHSQAHARAGAHALCTAISASGRDVRVEFLDAATAVTGTRRYFAVERPSAED